MGDAGVGSKGESADERSGAFVFDGGGLGRFRPALSEGDDAARGRTSALGDSSALGVGGVLAMTGGGEATLRIETKE